MISVLLVEDDEDLGELLRELLEHEGFELHIARNGTDALEVLATAIPDLIITDGMMPGMDGPALLGKLRADPALSSVPVILMSGADDLLRTEERLHGGQAILRKPFDPDALIALAHRLTRPPPASTPPGR